MNSLINVNIYSCPIHGYEWRDNITNCSNCFISSMNRLPWGNVISYIDETMESRKSDEQKEADRKQREQEDIQLRIKAHDSKTANRFANQRGELAIRIRAPCKWYCHNGIIGKETPAENGYEAGCRDHRNHKCPFYHPDEPEWTKVVEEHKNLKKGQKSRVEKLETSVTTTTTKQKYKNNTDGWSSAKTKNKK